MRPCGRYTGFGAAGKWEDLNCVAHFRFDVDAYLAGSGSRYNTVEVRAPCAAGLRSCVAKRDSML